MGIDLYQKYKKAKIIFHMANDVLHKNIINNIFNEPKNINKAEIVQIAIYIYSFIKAKLAKNFSPDMCAGHSLGEITALTLIKCIKFEDGLKLVNYRSRLLKKICDKKYIMVAIIGLKKSIIQEVCLNYNNMVLPSNYNYDKQIVISGKEKRVHEVCKTLQQIGAKKIIKINIQGIFHSPIINYIKKKMKLKINNIKFKHPICPIYQNVTSTGSMNVKTIKKNLIKHLFYPVKWDATINNMINDGAKKIIEIGPKKILTNFLRKMSLNDFL